MKEGEGGAAWVLMEHSLQRPGRHGRDGCCQTRSCTAGAPSRGSHHFLPLWEPESITPSSSPLSQILRRPDKVLVPLPHLLAGKAPLWAALDTAALGDWGEGRPSPPGTKPTS